MKKKIARRGFPRKSGLIARQSQPWRKFNLTKRSNGYVTTRAARAAANQRWPPRHSQSKSRAFVHTTGARTKHTSESQPLPAAAEF